MPTGHSLWAPSRLEQRMLCAGSHVMERDKPSSSSIYAAEGTAAHEVLTRALQEGRNAADYIGQTIAVDDHAFTVDDDMAEAVQVCIDYVRDIMQPDDTLLVDRRVNYSTHLGVTEDHAWGTLDVAVLKPSQAEIIVIDYKHGRGFEVSAERNPQMSAYALGALHEMGDLVEWERVRMVISQPRISRKPSEWDCSVQQLLEWGQVHAREAVCRCLLAESTYPDASEGATTWADQFLRPGEKQCKFCTARSSCPALRADVAETVLGFTPASPEEFEQAAVSLPDEHSPVDWLAAALTQVDLIEGWCKVVRAEAERRLRDGAAVPGWKLVPGKKGQRRWDKPADVEAVLKSLRLTKDQMYDLSLISPASAEKLLKAGAIGQRQWARLQKLITQSDGKAHVAPASDPRPALAVTPVAEDFTDLTAIN